MLLLNKIPIDFDECELLFYAGRYDDGSLAIVCTDSDGEPYATVTINLSYYFGVPKDDSYIYINHGLSDDFKKVVMDMFCISDSCLQTGYGLVEGGIKVRLKEKILKLIDDWKYGPF